VSFRVRYTEGARNDLKRLFSCLLARDPTSARRARNAINKGMEVLKDFPFTCRKACDDSPLLRELVIPFGASGYVVLFKIIDATTVTIIAVRHQHEDDYL
jgi:plasmid stabilization system protein ParE